MKLLFDARWIRPKSPDGITRFSTELIKELSKSDIEITYLINSKEQLLGLPKLNFILTNKPTSTKEVFQAKRLNRYNFDIVYTPNYIFGGIGRKFKLVRTVHDLIPFEHYNKNSNLTWKIFHSNKIGLKKFINDSDGLVTVSKTIKEELKKITKSKISVVYNAPLDVDFKNTGESSKNIIYIGRYEPYKNVDFLIKSMDYLQDYKLILIGSCDKERRIELLNQSKSKDRIRFEGSVADKIYGNMLKHAFCLATASKSEGFGLPVIEAMKIGCPVVCSDIAIFREIASGSALFFNNNDIHDYVEKIKYLESGEVRKKLTSQGIDSAKKFSWIKSAHELKSILSDVC